MRLMTLDELDSYITQLMHRRAHIPEVAYSGDWLFGVIGPIPPHNHDETNDPDNGGPGCIACEIEQ